MKSRLSARCRARLENVVPEPLFWTGLAVVVLALDWVTGPEIGFPIAFIFPVALAAWHGRFRWAVLFAIGLPILRFGFTFLRDTPWPVLASGINLGIRIVVLCGIAWLIEHSVAQRRHIEALKRLLPICAWCGKIRDERNTWQRLDAYLSANTDLSFTHCICSECVAKEFGQK